MVEDNDVLLGNGTEEGALNGEGYWQGYGGKEWGGRNGVVTNDQAEKEAGKNEESLSGEWRAERIETPFGITDDVVTLINGKTYHFFKLPHKV